MIGADFSRQQCLHGRNEIAGHRAADAAVRELDDVFLGAIGIRTGFQDFTVDTLAAELVDEHREFLAVGIGHQMPDQRGLARTEKAGDDGDGNFGERSHSAASDKDDMGGMRASDCFRKISGRVRQGTMPSEAAA